MTNEPDPNRLHYLILPRQKRTESQMVVGFQQSDGLISNFLRWGETSSGHDDTLTHQNSKRLQVLPVSGPGCNHAEKSGLAPALRLQYVGRGLPALPNLHRLVRSQPQPRGGRNTHTTNIQHTQHAYNARTTYRQLNTINTLHLTHRPHNVHQTDNRLLLLTHST